MGLSPARPLVPRGRSSQGEGQETFQVIWRSTPPGRLGFPGVLGKSLVDPQIPSKVQHIGGKAKIEPSASADSALESGMQWQSASGTCV